MTIEHGIIINGEVLPGTERCIRDSAAWWAPGDIGTRPRKGHRVERLLGHWTAGNPRVGPTAGPRVVAAMKARKRADGSRLNVGVDFIISWDGLIWQTSDLALATTHIGHRPTILSSVGVETCWPGKMTQARKLGMLDAVPVMGSARGAAVKACAPSPALLDAWRWLFDALTTAEHPLLAIPRARGSATKPGVMEHADVPASTKIDCAGLLVGALGLTR